MNLEFFFFFHFAKKMGRLGDGKRDILLGWPNASLCTVEFIDVISVLNGNMKHARAIEFD